MARNPLRAALQLPAHAIYTRWEWRQRMTSVAFDISVHRDPGTSTGEYLSPFNGEIDGAQVYFGMQTDVFRPDRPDPGDASGRGIGKGLLFSTWWSFDAADTRTGDDGFIQLGTHEGRFVGVRRAFDWSVGDYRMQLARGDADSAGDWFDLTIQPLGAKAAGHPGRPEARGEPVWIGALRFRRLDPLVPATLSARATGFVEVYGGARTFGDISPWWCDLQGYGDGERPVGAVGSYPAFPHGQDVPNADTWYDADRDRVHLVFGGDTDRSHDPGRLF